MSFNFRISLSVLNSLGRDLYRNFITILGEAISNSWDADAKNVWILIDRENSNMSIIDDGYGMDEVSFQNQFLKVGYSKRKLGNSSPNGRPYIGRKGIGKLALLSCSKKLHIASKVINGKVIGGVIDNSELDKAITDDIEPQKYSLNEINPKISAKLNKQRSGTLLLFEQLNPSINNTVEKIKKMIALSFKFILFDKSFNIYVNGDKITLDEIDELIDNTQFIWTVNGNKDIFSQKIIKHIGKRSTYRCLNIKNKLKITGFIASVILPRHLKITGLDERASIDIFSNGRLREKDILRRIQSSRVVPQYLYGQIDLNELESEKESFTTNRESIKADSEKFQQFLTEFQKIINDVVFPKWDKWRNEIGEDGDLENEKMSKADIKAASLFNEITNDLKKNYGTTKASKTMIDEIVKKIRSDGIFNSKNYVGCFLAENLLRTFIRHKNIKLSEESQNTALEYKKKEEKNKLNAGIAFDVRKNSQDLSYYLSFHDLVSNIDKSLNVNLSRDINIYKILRDAIAHTAILTKPAKNQLSVCISNINSKIDRILSNKQK